MRGSASVAILALVAAAVAAPAGARETEEPIARTSPSDAGSAAKPAAHGGDHARHARHEREGASDGPHSGHHGMRMEIVDGGLVTNANADELPKDCATVRAEHRFVVEAGREAARAHPGLTFAYDAPEWRVEPCSRVTVTLRNRDEVRHQWMLHGLPAYLYPMGMFTLTADGGGEVTGTFIVPSEPDTGLVHCDVAGHMEQGMKGQLVIGGGRGDLPSVPGRSAPRHADSYDVAARPWLWLLGGLAGVTAFAVARRR